MVLSIPHKLLIIHKGGEKTVVIQWSIQFLDWSSKLPSLLRNR